MFDHFREPASRRVGTNVVTRNDVIIAADNGFAMSIEILNHQSVDAVAVGADPNLQAAYWATSADGMFSIEDNLRSKRIEIPMNGGLRATIDPGSDGFAAL